jgi:hypothetical protein
MQVQESLESLGNGEFLSGFAMPFEERYFPLGFPLQLQTNSRNVTSAAEEAWGLFGPEFPEVEPIRLSLAVAGESDAILSGLPAFRSRGHLMTIVWDQDNQIVCDFRDRSAVGWVTPAIAGQRARLRRHLLEAAVMSLLVQAHLAPIHGALIKRNGRGILLCGASRAGKSTLAFACARDGWSLFSDDGTYLVRDRPGIYGIGNPHSVSLREDVKFLFPEIADRIASPRPGGKIGIEVRTRDLQIATAAGSPIDHLVFLDRTAEGSGRLEAAKPEEVLAWCDSYAILGPDHIRQAQHRSYRRLLTAGLWRMHYSDLASALEMLDELQASVK